MCGAKGGPLALEEEPADVVVAGLGPRAVLRGPCDKTGGRSEGSKVRPGMYILAKGWCTETAGGGPCGPGPRSVLGLRSAASIAAVHVRADPSSEASSTVASAAPSPVVSVAVASVVEAAGKPMSTRASSRTESCKGSRSGSMVAERRSGGGRSMQDGPVGPNLRVEEGRQFLQAMAEVLYQRCLQGRADDA